MPEVYQSSALTRTETTDGVVYTEGWVEITFDNRSSTDTATCTFDDTNVVTIQPNQQLTLRSINDEGFNGFTVDAADSGALDVTVVGKEGKPR